MAKMRLNNSWNSRRDKAQLQPANQFEGRNTERSGRLLAVSGRTLERIDTRGSNMQGAVGSSAAGDEPPAVSVTGEAVAVTQLQEKVSKSSN
jgi:hypothetical protein